MVKVKRDLTGLKFGRLTVLYQVEDLIERDGKHRAQWHCKCDCGNECNVNQRYLVEGDTSSCGCYRKETAAKNLMDSKINTNIYEFINDCGICKLISGDTFLLIEKIMIK